MQKAKNSYYYNCFALLSQTGMRAGEAGALTWSDVDLKKRTVLIHRTLEQENDREWIISNVTKTNSGLRRLRLSDEAADALIRQKQKMQGLYGEDAVIPLLSRLPLPGSGICILPAPQHRNPHRHPAY